MSDSKHRNSAPPEKHQGSARSTHSASHDKAATGNHASATSGSNRDASDEADNKSGRVAFDSHGNPIWEWQTAPGVFETDVTTQRLKKLEAAELSLAATQPVSIIDKGSAKNTSRASKTKSKEDTGFNPYNSDVPLQPRTDRTRAAHPAMVHKKPPSRRPQTQPEKPAGMWDKFKSKFT